MDHTLIEVPLSKLDGVIKDIAGCIIERRSQVIAARSQKGGWEGWLQVELASALVKRWGLSYDVLREQPVYGNAQRTDLWFDPVPLSKTKIPKIGIELKVESEYQTNVSKSLRNRFVADIKKCVPGPDRDHLGLAGTHFYAVGITSQKSDLKDYKQVAIETNSLITCCALIEDEQPEHCVYMLWWGKAF